MTVKEFLRTERGERIDQPDFDHAARVSQRDGLAQIADGFFTGPDPSHPSDAFDQYVLKGFSAVVTGSTVLTVTRGDAILGFRTPEGLVQQGAILTGGDETKAVDMNGYQDPATFGVYVRFAFREDSFQNRLFWNASAPTPVEFPRSIATRFAENWDLQIEQTSPGDEWMKIGEAAMNAGVVTYTDQRSFFFEGRPNVSPPYSVQNAEWGSANDRLATRDANGVHGLRRFVRAVQRQIYDIIGGSVGWWEDPTTGTAVGSDGPRPLTALNDEKLARAGTSAGHLMAGGIDPNVTEAYDLGESSTPRRWRDIFARVINLATDGTGLGIDLADSGPTSMALSSLAGVNNQSFLANTPNGGPGATTALLQVFAGGLKNGAVEASCAEFWITGNTVIGARDEAGQNEWGVDNTPNGDTGGTNAKTVFKSGVSKTGEIELGCVKAFLSAICEGERGLAYFTLTARSSTAIAANGALVQVTYAFDAPPSSGTVNYAAGDRLVAWEFDSTTITNMLATGVYPVHARISTTNNSIDIIWAAGTPGGTLTFNLRGAVLRT